MGLLHDMVDEQIHLLKSRGYDEESLKSPNKPGSLAAQLSAKKSQEIHRSLFDPTPSSFEIDTVGFFNNNAETAHFKLKY
jgi:hypothetical protein